MRTLMPLRVYKLTGDVVADLNIVYTAHVLDKAVAKIREKEFDSPAFIGAHVQQAIAQNA